MRYLFLLGLLVSLTANATDCSFHYLLRSFKPKGELVSESIVEYPQMINDSSGPLFFPLIKELPSSCNDTTCELVALLGEKLIAKSTYKFDKSRGYWVPSTMPPVQIELSAEEADGKKVQFKIQQKDKTLCSHSIEVDLRD